MIFKILKLNVLFLFTLISFLSANEIKDISVKGNQRISKETIIVLGNIELNKNYNSESINKVLKNSYSHHIERLMVIGNFMLLCEIKPNAVYKWFMELYVDAYDWVMVPNIYGMSQFSDGGLMSSKPYISSSNYIKKMSDFKNGPWREIWDGLYWRFINNHRQKLYNNIRMRFMINLFDKMDQEKQDVHLKNAQNFLDTLK